MEQKLPANFLQFWDNLFLKYRHFPLVREYRRHAAGSEQRINVGLKVANAAVAVGNFSDMLNSIRIEQSRNDPSYGLTPWMAISGLHWVLAHTEGLHLTHPGEQVRRNTADYFCHLVRLCDDLGGRFIIVGSPKQRNLVEGVSFDQAWNYALEVFAPAVGLACDKGITLCFEPLAPAETNFINTAADAIRFALATGSPAMKIILDVKAMSSEGRPIPEIIASAVPHFAYFHANDPNLKGPGFGKMDFHPILEALRRANHTGYISVEVFNFDEGPEVIARQSLDYLRRCLPPVP